MFFDRVDGIYFDGRKDSTLVQQKRISHKTYMTTELQEHFEVVGEPYEFDLAHASPKNGKDLTIAEHNCKKIKDTELEKS